MTTQSLVDLVRRYDHTRVHGLFLQAAGAPEGEVLSHDAEQIWLNEIGPETVRLSDAHGYDVARSLIATLPLSTDYIVLLLELVDQNEYFDLQPVVAYAGQLAADRAIDARLTAMYRDGMTTVQIANQLWELSGLADCYRVEPVAA